MSRFERGAPAGGGAMTPLMRAQLVELRTWFDRWSDELRSPPGEGGELTAGEREILGEMLRHVLESWQAEFQGPPHRTPWHEWRDTSLLLRMELARRAFSRLGLHVDGEKPGRVVLKDAQPGEFGGGIATEPEDAAPSV